MRKFGNLRIWKVKKRFVSWIERINFSNFSKLKKWNDKIRKGNNHFREVILWLQKALRRGGANEHFYSESRSREEQWQDRLWSRFLTATRSNCIPCWVILSRGNLRIIFFNTKPVDPLSSSCLPLHEELIITLCLIQNLNIIRNMIFKILPSPFFLIYIFFDIAKLQFDLLNYILFWWNFNFN